MYVNILQTGSVTGRQERWEEARSVKEKGAAKPPG